MAPASSSSSRSSSLTEVQGTGEAAHPHGSPAEEEQGRGHAPRRSLGGRPCSARGAGEIGERRPMETAQRSRGDGNAVGNAIALLETDRCESKQKHCSREAKSSLPSHFAISCWSQS
jgi:hypothetical protein